MASGAAGGKRVGACCKKEKTARSRRHPGARAAYNEFLTLWKDAAPDIPILKQAQAEYAKLK